MKKAKYSAILILIISLILCKNVYASFADYTDEDAAQDEKKMIEEQNKNFNTEKSKNNYLKDLKIIGGTLSPNFERQTLEYILKLQDKTNEIEIFAFPEDSSAKVFGTGRLNVVNVSECNIEVIAESGTTRTYFIKLIKPNEELNNNITDNKVAQNEKEENTIIESKIENIIEEKKETNNMQKQNSKKVIVLAIAGGIIIVILGIFVFTRKNNVK